MTSNTVLGSASNTGRQFSISRGSVAPRTVVDDALAWHRPLQSWVTRYRLIEAPSQGPAVITPFAPGIFRNHEGVVSSLRGNFLTVRYHESSSLHRPRVVLLYLSNHTSFVPIIHVSKKHQFVTTALHDKHPMVLPRSHYDYDYGYDSNVHDDPHQGGSSSSSNTASSKE
jgi:hypothetical protein